MTLFRLKPVMNPLDPVADLISEIEMPAAVAHELRRRMWSFSNNYTVTYDAMRKAPGFRAIWDAVLTAACQSASETVELE